MRINSGIYKIYVCVCVSLELRGVDSLAHLFDSHSSPPMDVDCDGMDCLEEMRNLCSETDGFVTTFMAESATVVPESYRFVSGLLELFQLKMVGDVFPSLPTPLGGDTYACPCPFHNYRTGTSPIAGMQGVCQCLPDVPTGKLV